MTRSERYARYVIDPENAKQTGRLIKLAAQRFVNDLARTDIIFDESEANKIVNFGEGYCNQWEGDWEGVPVTFEDWQCFIFQQVYGWIRKDNGLRRFEEVYIQIAKKNGKSTMCAVLALFHLFADERIKTPKVFTSANNEDQAKICVSMSGRIIEASPDLFEYVRDGDVSLMNYKDNITEVVHYGKNGFIKALSKESSDKKSKTSGGKHGINASLGITDEIGLASDYGAAKAIKTSMASRKERLMFYITTAGFNMNGPCYSELRKVGIEVLEGVSIKDNYLPIIFEMDKPEVDGKVDKITPKWLLENDWAWKQSNPNLGVSVQKDFLKSSLEDAVSYGGTTEVDTLTLNFNEWMETPEVWIPSDVWNKNTQGASIESLAARQCFAGLEIVSGLSLNCLALFFPNFNGETHAVRCMFWMPSDAMHDKSAALDMRRWSDEGLIELCPGNVVDNDFIWSKVRDMFALYNVDSLAFNKILTNHDILQSLVRAGITVNPISQGYSGISTPTKEWEALLTAAQIEHFGNPVLAWQNMNTMVNRNKEQEIRVEKSGGRTAGITACINAVAQWAIYKAQNSDDGRIESW